MPFVKKNSSQGSLPPTDARNIFIGRESELLFFVQNIPKPADPTHNIISISGQGGVGKSTLLMRLIDETHSPSFKECCITAIVDQRQITPASIMEKFADQLHLTDEFEKTLSHYKKVLRKLHSEQETMPQTFLERATRCCWSRGRRNISSRCRTTFIITRHMGIIQEVLFSSQ